MAGTLARLRKAVICTALGMLVLAGTAPGMATGAVNRHPFPKPVGQKALAFTCDTERVWQNLELCGWAGPENTGYPSDQSFRRTIRGGR